MRNVKDPGREDTFDFVSSLVQFFPSLEGMTTSDSQVE